MRDVALLGARLLLGGYMGIHASQKLLGKFHGPGLDGAGAAAHNREGGLMAIRGGIKLPVNYLTLALTLAATGPGKYRIGPSLPKWATALGVLGGGALAGTLIAKMVTGKPAGPVEATAGAAGAAGADEPQDD